MLKQNCVQNFVQSALWDAAFEASLIRPKWPKLASLESTLLIPVSVPRCILRFQNDNVFKNIFWDK